MTSKSREDRSVALESRRLEAIRFLRDEHVRPADVARVLGVSRAAVSMWWSRYRRRGEEGLRRTRRSGRPTKLDRSALARLRSLLAESAVASGFGSDRWTEGRIAAVIERETGVRYHPSSAGRIARALGWRARPWRASRGIPAPFPSTPSLPALMATAPTDSATRELSEGALVQSEGSPSKLTPARNVNRAALRTPMSGPNPMSAGTIVSREIARSNGERSHSARDSAASRLGRTEEANGRLPCLPGHGASAGAVAILNARPAARDGESRRRKGGHD